MNNVFDGRQLKAVELSWEISAVIYEEVNEGYGCRVDRLWNRHEKYKVIKMSSALLCINVGGSERVS